jgi:hypothetical protein
MKGAHEQIAAELETALYAFDGAVMKEWVDQLLRLTAQLFAAGEWKAAETVAGSLQSVIPNVDKQGVALEDWVFSGASQGVAIGALVHMGTSRGNPKNAAKAKCMAACVECMLYVTAYPTSPGAGGMPNMPPEAADSLFGLLAVAGLPVAAKDSVVTKIEETLDYSRRVGMPLPNLAVYRDAIFGAVDSGYLKGALLLANLPYHAVDPAAGDDGAVARAYDARLGKLAELAEDDPPRWLPIAMAPLAAACAKVGPALTALSLHCTALTAVPLHSLHALHSLHSHCTHLSTHCHNSHPAPCLVCTSARAGLGPPPTLSRTRAGCTRRSLSSSWSPPRPTPARWCP